VFSQFKGAIEELFKDDVNEVKYQDMAFEVDAADGMDFIAERTRAEDPSDPDLVEEAKAYQNLLKIVKAELTDVQVVKVGPKDEDGSLASDQGLYGLLIVGRARDGSLAGLIPARSRPDRAGFDLRPGARPLRGPRAASDGPVLRPAPARAADRRVAGMPPAPRPGPHPPARRRATGCTGAPGTEAGTEAGRSVARACRRSARSSRT